MNDDGNRIVALDVLRGVAVLGILVMNITSFALPWMDYINPHASGEASGADLTAWAFSFVLIDGKMRALFAMLLGASMLIVIESAEMDGRDGLAAHRRRMLWLIPIGLAHHLLIWDGDILLSLAIAGLLAARFVHREPMDLAKWAFGFIGLQLLISASVVTFAFFDGETETLLSNAAERNEELAFMLGSWGSIAADRLMFFPYVLFDFILFTLPESLGFVLLGMALMKAGFLTSQWEASQYRATVRHCALVGIPAMTGLAIWTIMSGSALVAQANIIAFSLPFRIPLAIGYAALVLLLLSQMSDGWLLSALASVGKMALSNYLASSILMTSLFYGYGLGWFGQLDRVSMLGPVLVLWVAMLLWSPLWMKQFRYGPAEWVWRSLARSKLESIRRS